MKSAKLKIARASILILSALELAACGGGGSSGTTNSNTSTTASTLSTTALTVTAGQTSIAVGATDQITATGGTSPYSFYISSGNGTVNPTTGLFTAPGTADTTVIAVVDSLGDAGSVSVTVTSGGGGGGGNGTVQSTFTNATFLSVNRYYFSAANDGGSDVTVDRKVALGWEHFTIDDLSSTTLTNGDTIEIQAGNGDYFSAQCGGGPQTPGTQCGNVFANRTVAAGWEMFTILKQPGGSAGESIVSGDKFSLQSYGGWYCSAELGGGPGSVFDCRRTKISTWETFTISY